MAWFSAVGRVGPLVFTRLCLRRAYTGATEGAYCGVAYPEGRIVETNILHVELNRQTKANSLNIPMWEGLRKVFRKASADKAVRCVVISGKGENFCAGIDLQHLGDMFMKRPSGDVARMAAKLRAEIKHLQESFTAMEQCPKPVIAAIHGACIGAGVDLITACDIRYCTATAHFSVKEAAMGLAADVGSLARLPKVVSSDSAMRDWCYTARGVKADEALQHGMVSMVLQDKDALLAKAMETARQIAANSPVAVNGTKMMLNYGRNHGVTDCLDYVAVWNSAMLQTSDIGTAVVAKVNSQKPEFDDVSWTKET